MHDSRLTTSTRTWARLEHFLINKDLAFTSHPLSFNLLNKHHLASYAFDIVPTENNEKNKFLAAFAKANSKHLLTKYEFLKLAKAWQQAGIKTILFKGFYLAEFIYSNPGQRPYHDLDLLLHKEDVVEASQLAQKLGWEESWRSSQLDTNWNLSHEVLHLRKLGGKLRIDGHRSLLHYHSPFRIKQERITNLMWTEAQERHWENTSIYHLSAVDNLLIGLVLNRTWSPQDNWRIKVHDYPDFQRLIQYGKLTEKQLFERAKILGCSQALKTYLSFCNPFTKTLRLKPSSFTEKILLHTKILTERGFPGLEYKARTTISSRVPFLKKYF